MDATRSGSRPGRHAERDQDGYDPADQLPDLADLLNGRGGVRAPGLEVCGVQALPVGQQLLQVGLQLGQVGRVAAEVPQPVQTYL